MIVPMVVTHFLRRAHRLYPHKKGVVCGGTSFTYGEYFERVNRLSHALLDLGVQRGDRVVYLGANCHRLLESYYGVVQIGAVLLPLNIRLSPAELEYIVNDAEATIFLMDPQFLSQLADFPQKLPTVRHFVLLADEGGDYPVSWPRYETLLHGASAEPAEVPMEESDLAELFYTSGTTGQPKGVMLSHRNLYANALNFLIAHTLTDADVQLHTIPLFHVNGWGTPHALTGMGGTHVMLQQFDPRVVCELIQSQRVTIACMVPTMVNTLLNFTDLKLYDLSSLQRIVVGGAPSPESFVTQVRERLGCDYIAGYGLTETSPLLTSAVLKSHLRALSEDEQSCYKSMTGLPVVGVDVRVVDEEGNEVAHDGIQVGEIVARGDSVMMGYWKHPDETAQVIRDGWLHTWDMATVNEEGYIRIVDRKKDLIISGGENIASIEIENVLYTHPAVLECAVIAVPDPKWGEVPLAFVVLKEGQQASGEEIISHCATRLARYKLPKTVDFVTALPKGGTGKILKSVLRQMYGGAPWTTSASS